MTKLRGPPASVSEHNGKRFDDFLRHARQARAKKTTIKKPNYPIAGPNKNIPHFDDNKILKVCHKEKLEN